MDRTDIIVEDLGDIKITLERPLKYVSKEFKYIMERANVDIGSEAYYTFLEVITDEVFNVLENDK